MVSGCFSRVMALPERSVKEMEPSSRVTISLQLRAPWGASLGARGGFPCPTAGEYRHEKEGAKAECNPFFYHVVPSFLWKPLRPGKCPIPIKKATKGSS